MFDEGFPVAGILNNPWEIKISFLKRFIWHESPWECRTRKRFFPNHHSFNFAQITRSPIAHTNIYRTPIKALHLLLL